jgi:hypothetical protein
MQCHRLLCVGTTFVERHDMAVWTPLLFYAHTQVASLPNLQHLHICECGMYTSEQLEPLAGLRGSLRSLHLDNCGTLPACLSVLRGLTALRLEICEQLSEAAEASLAAAFSALPGMAQLEVDIPNLRLQQLSNLQAVTALQLHGADPGESLPAGPWLASLRRFAAEPDVVYDSLASLSAATSLELMALEAWREVVDGVGDVRAIVQWAAGCSCPLRQLAVDYRVLPDVDINLLESVLVVHRWRPSLQIDLLHDASHRVYSPEFLSFAFHHKF